MAIPVLTRRSAASGLLLGAVAAVVGFAVARRSDAARPRPAGAAANGYGATMASGGGSSGGTRLAALAQVPTGGGVILADDRVVLTRPTADDVQGFSATCTHQGCTVSSVSDGRIGCPCHGSEFDAATGAVVRGPATRPLPRVAVVVRDQTVFTT